MSLLMLHISSVCHMKMKRHETSYSKGRCAMSKSCSSCILYTAESQNAEEAIVLCTMAIWCIHFLPTLLTVLLLYFPMVYSRHRL
jgi:hypothetical protein